VPNNPGKPWFFLGISASLRFNHIFQEARGLAKKDLAPVAEVPMFV